MYRAESIMTYYKEFGTLTESLRKQLCHHLISYFIHFRIWIKRSDFPHITKLIKEEFPDEEEAYYYQPVSQMNKNPQGRLYCRYVNQTGSWRRKFNGVYKNIKSRSKTTENYVYVNSNPGKIRFVVFAS